MEEYLEIGQIVNTNGLKGMLKIKPFTDDITRFEDLEFVYIQKGQELIEKNIEEVKYVKNMVLLKLEGIDNIDEAEKYRNLYIKINKKDIGDIPEDSYLIVDMLKCNVYTDEDKLLGKMVDVLTTGSNDVYVVKTESGKEILLPAIKEVVKDINIQNKKIIVKLMDGLI
jgi:16S rRNA processing protein RimM